ncbi:MAG TPA: hypothetical protein VHC47_13655 [Mucilaginibacter sp.]|nr:hypothetical protein [Mucilaginibacter sp.]
MKTVLWVAVMLLLSDKLFAQHIDLQQMLADGKLMTYSHNSMKSAEVNGKQCITTNGNIWLKGITFSYGTIALDIRGRNKFLGSFPGIAFHAADTSSEYDVVYFRPFNFRSPDPVRRTWSVQYCSLPDYPYDRLRKEDKGQFESEILPDPVPEDWIHARIVVSRDSISVYVNGMDKPSLTVKNLQPRSNGMIGLWADATTADFANLVIIQNH